MFSNSQPTTENGINETMKLNFISSSSTSALNCCILSLCNSLAPFVFVVFVDNAAVVVVVAAACYCYLIKFEIRSSAGKTGAQGATTYCNDGAFIVSQMWRSVIKSISFTTTHQKKSNTITERARKTVKCSIFRDCIHQCWFQSDKW